MSEYQYYEFQAIDRPLNDAAMEALRNISSRAEITRTSMTNEYNYGDFRGDSDRLMEQYFDAHLYLANWGTHRLMLRLPARAFPIAQAEPYAVPEILLVREVNDHVILDFHTPYDDGGGYGYEEGGGQLAGLLPLRDDLLAGDLRCLYLGWLVAAQGQELEEDEVEPPVPPGLGKLSASLTAFADFFRLDDDVITAAAAKSSDDVLEKPSDAKLAAWVKRLPAGETAAFLVQVMQGHGPGVAAELRRRFREATAKPAPAGAASQRTVGELLAAAEVVAEQEKKKRAEQAARKARKEAEERAAYLASLVGREDKIWAEIEAAIETKQATEYDRAVNLLKDLRDLIANTNAQVAFTTRFRALLDRHKSKSALKSRLTRAGLK